MFHVGSNGQFMFHLCSMLVPNTQNTTPIKGIPKRGRAPKAPAPFWGGGRRPPPFMGVVFCVFGTKIEHKWNINVPLEPKYNINGT